jgi:outer membrane protein insertion porin family
MEIVESHTERYNDKYMILHVTIFEGQRYKVGSITINGNTLFPTADLERRLKMKAGDIYTPGGLSANYKAIEDYYGARGYLDTAVRVSKIPNVETGQMDLVMAIREGALTYIDLIEIRGNVKTKDKVIRRELAVNPGEIYDTVRVDASTERLKNLGYFSKVESFPRPTDLPNRKDVVVTVEEQRTGTMTFGAGFSSIDSLIGFVEVQQSNFDLFNAPSFTGGGQKLRARLQLGFERQDATLSFVEPWFLDRKLALGTDLYYNSASYLSDYYEESRYGGALSLEKALTQFIRGRVEYRLENIDTDVDADASKELKSQDGKQLRSAAALKLVYDSRDSVFLTLRGNRSEVGAEVAGGPWGGDVSVYKLQARTQFYFPFFNQHVLSFILSGGVVEAFGDTEGQNPPWNDVPIFDRYFLGGANTLRGFDYRAVGPRDAKGEPIGGNTSVYGTVEYTFPIVERIRGALFFDAGEIREESFSFAIDDIHANVGVGVRLNLPIGPLRLDYGYPVIRDPAAGTSGRIQFSVGYQY